ncbi:hypothetical protein BDQ17DRAFT_1333639 [Cyathus striatus]|nr:hypothetical protein BDQ17DRAFT_1333639 [Cyathus striatus]
MRAWESGRHTASTKGGMAGQEGQDGEHVREYNEHRERDSKRRGRIMSGMGHTTSGGAGIMSEMGHTVSRGAGIDDEQDEVHSERRCGRRGKAGDGTSSARAGN